MVSKTEFDFGAISKLQDISSHGSIYWMAGGRANQYCPIYHVWDGSNFDYQVFKLGKLFISEEECQAYCEYLNSLTDEYS